MPVKPAAVWPSAGLVRQGRRQLRGTKEDSMKTMDDLMKELPPELKKEVEDFAQFLLERRARRTGGKLRQDWAGALRAFRDQYSSLDLQKKALEWRGD